MNRTLTKEELVKLGLSADESGRIFLDGQEIKPTMQFTKGGLSYPKVAIYDPDVWSRTKTHGNRNILASRIVWAYNMGKCPGDCLVKHFDGNPLNMELKNLYLCYRRLK